MPDRRLAVPNPTGAPWVDLARILLTFAALAAALRLAPVSATVEIDGLPQTTTTRAGTVAALLAEVGVDVEAGDLVSPPPGRHLARGATVVVKRAPLVRIAADGRVHAVRTHATTPLGMLHAAGLGLGLGRGPDLGGGRAGHPPALVVVDGRARRTDRALQDEDGDGVTGRIQPAGLSLVASARAVAADRSRHGSGVAMLADAPASGGAPVRARETWAGGRGKAADGVADRSARDEVHIQPLESAPITVVEDGIPLTMRLTGRTVGEALEAAGIHLWDEDVLFPDADSLLSRTSRVAIHRSMPFRVTADGRTREARALADTVGQALAVAGEALVGRDYSIPPADTPMRAGVEVQVIRVVEDFLVQQVDVPFGTETEADAGMPLDERRILREGQPGAKTQRIRIVYEDGEEISRELVEETLDREPVAQRVAYGTRIDWSTVETEAGPKRYWRRLRVYATSYSASRAGTPTWAPWYGLTRLGWPMRKGIVAVDPRIIPLRTELFVPGYGLGVAGDTGGGVRQYHIDLGFDDDNYESWHRWVDVYLLEPLPPEGSIPWILP